MVQWLGSLADVASEYQAIIFDQWGVLHDGTTAYPGAIDALRDLHTQGCRLAVLSNSGKRAAPNRERVTSMGYPPEMFDCVMTSGEALWSDIAAGRITERRLFAIARVDGDAEGWAEGLPVTLTETPEKADAVLLMGLPDGSGEADFQSVLDHALAHNLTIYCSNPDRQSPRAGHENVLSPGAVAHHFATLGGEVVFYGKPHRAVFDAVSRELDLPPEVLLMVGDSLEHDIAGGHAAGWATVFVSGGLHRSLFATGDPNLTLRQLAEAESAPLPDYSLPMLQ